jgi:hypothetical protein
LPLRDLDAIYARCHFADDDGPIVSGEEPVKIPMLALVVGVSLALPFAAFGQSNDATYCAALSKLFREIVANGISDSPESVAMAQCAAGNTAAGIPVLEKSLREQKVSLPPRN